MKKIKIVGNMILFVSLILLLAACSNNGGGGGGIVPETNKIRGTVTVAGIQEQGVEVKIKELNKTTKTDANGVYEFKDISDGTYTLIFSKEEADISDLIRKVVVSGGKTVVQNLDPIADNETSVQDAEDLVNTINDSGIQMKDTIESTFPQAGTKFEQEVSPYMQNLGKKLEYFTRTLEVWSEGDDGDLLAPGEYTGEWSGGEFILTKVNPYDIEQGQNLIWDITFNNYYLEDTIDTVTIEMTNPDEVEVVDESAGRIIEIDLTRAEFQYYQKMNNDHNLYSVDIGFTLNTDSYQTITLKDKDDYDLEYEYEVKVPDLAQVNMNGIMIDKTIMNIGEETYEPIGQVIVAGLLAVDTKDNNRIDYSGLFDSEKLNLYGNMSLIFSSFPPYAEITEDNIPILSGISYSGSLSTDFMTLSGDFSIELTEVESEGLMPRTIIINGSYKYLDDQATTENEYVMLDGSLGFAIDYSTRTDFEESEGPGNYIGGVISFSGGFEKGNFHPLNLDLNIDREGYTEYSADLEYIFGDGKFINAILGYNGSVINFEAYNEKGIKIMFTIDENEDYTKSKKIGTITNYYKSETFAEIYVVDMQPEIHFSNGNIISFMY